MNRVGALLCLILMAGVAFAAQTTGPSAETDAILCPQLINYQGYLTDGSGSPLTGSYNLTFTLWDAGSGGSALWTETQAGVSVAAGVFNVLLGSSTAITSVPDDGACWLEVAVGTDTISPRVRMVSVPYSYKAGDAAALQGNAVNDGTPSSGQVLAWSGTDWAPATPAAGDTALWLDLNTAVAPKIAPDSVTITGTGGVRAFNTSGHGVFGRSHATGIGNQGVLGQTFATGGNAGVWGYGGVAGSHGVMGATDASSSYGVYGWNASSSYGYGVYGTAYNGYLYGILGCDDTYDAGVYGYAYYSGDYGVYGVSAQYGVYGASVNAGTYGYLGSDYYDCGVFGRADNSGDYGLYGYSYYAGPGYGVYACAYGSNTTTSYGVYAYSYYSIPLYARRGGSRNGTAYSEYNSAGALKGFTYWGDTFAFGVCGHSYNDYHRTGGVLGANVSGTYWGSLGYRNSSGSTYGGYFTSYTSGSGFDDDAVGVGIGAAGDLMGGWMKGKAYGAHIKGDRYALYTDGNSYTNGVSAVLQETDGVREAAYVPVSQNVDVYASGVAELRDGQASVSFSSSFAKMVSDQVPVVVTVTPMGPEPVYLASSDASGFSVRAVDGTGSVRFSWIAVGRRAGYEQNPHLPVELARTDFDELMDEVCFNEGDLRNSARPMWFDGTSVRFDPVPEPVISKAPEPRQPQNGVDEAVEPEPAPIHRTSSVSPTGQ